MNSQKCLWILVEYAKKYGKQPDPSYKYIDINGKEWTLNEMWDIIEAKRSENIHLRFKNMSEKREDRYR